MCSEKDEFILSLFKQIDDSILLLMQWNQEVNGADDYLLSPEGMKKDRKSVV